MIRNFFVKTYKLVFSRTALFIVLTALSGGLEAVKDALPAGWQPYVTGALALIALYFRANPRQSFSQ